ncbi:replicase [Porcine stool-associated circular virus/BEL/15V010]|uniref:replicase n=1 Tax=Porcine stool-associated circular virus/BEL/15V010 TaxID=2017724 RepID=UPI000B7BC11B|nr:replicase [Porcine stool-associated circular virus/BEL/15V010]ASM93471.1 replicase [Porcine stool-associated circular virus/BEL/15V010]
METQKSVRIQHKWIYATYNDSKECIEGPAMLLDTLAEQLKRWKPYYAVACEERAPTTGMRHFHALILCREQVRARSTEVLEVKGIKPHLEKVNNNLRRVIEYIKKDGTVAELNKDMCPIKMEKQTKEEKNRLLLSGNLEQEFIKGTIGAVDVIRGFKIRSLFQQYSKPDDYKRRLILWFKGPTGEGKTKTAIEIAKEWNLKYWISNTDLRWFDGYDNQEIAVIDDFRKSMLTDWNFLLRLLDGYNLLVPIKGAHVKWDPRIIIVTTPATPEEAFQWITRDGQIQEWDRQEQLTRRLTFEDELQVYDFPLWEDEKQRLVRTIEKFLKEEKIIQEEQAVIEEELSMSPILPEPSQIDEA